MTRIADVTATENELHGLFVAGLDGDGAAYHRFLQRLASLLRGYFRRRLQQLPDEVEDLVQDTFPDEVGRARLIRSPLVPWSVWFKACGIALPEPREGAQFNDVGLMLDAAAAGFGVTLMRLKLGRDWLDNGRLVRLSPRQVVSPNHHFICWKPGTLDRRLRACYSGVQATIPPAGAPELRALELYLKVRAAGKPLDGPSIRR